MSRSPVSDFLILYGRRPDYPEWCSIQLNEKMIFYRQAAMVAYGVAVAVGNMSPDVEYFEAQSNNLEEAKIKKAQHDALQNRMMEE